ncbi:MAG: hypothetical protein R3F19_16400 [Verrucomicrobiales bacterium]
MKRYDRHGFGFLENPARCAGGVMLSYGLALVSCEDSGHLVESQSGFTKREPIPFSVPARSVNEKPVHPEVYRFLEAISNMETQIADLEADLYQVQELHESYDFDAFLTLDPWTVEKESLFYLSHFCDAGYFTVQRKVLLSLLEKKIARKKSEAKNAAQPGASKEIEQRLADAMLFREERIMDLEFVIDLYNTRQGAQEFLVPDYISPDDLAAMRTDVAERLDRQRALVAELDREISVLKAQYESSPEKFSQLKP